MNKLINRNTGQIVVYGEGIVDLKSLGCKNVAEMLEAGWEEYKEPKPQVVYYIDRDGEIVPYKNVEYPKRVFNNEQNREIGNYFETREDAEKAVDKLKAWKRLKDTIIRIDRASFDDVGTATLFIRYKKENHKEVNKDLDLLFGGEE